MKDGEGVIVMIVERGLNVEESNLGPEIGLPTWRAALLRLIYLTVFILSALGNAGIRQYLTL